MTKLRIPTVHSTYSWPGFPEVYLSLDVSKSKCKDVSVAVRGQTKLVVLFYAYLKFDMHLPYSRVIPRQNKCNFHIISGFSKTEQRFCNSFGKPCLS